MVKGEVGTGGDAHVFELLDRTLRILRDDMLARTAEADWAWLRSSQHRVLSMVPTGGIRVGDLATVAGMTPQSMGEFARELERQGLLRTERDEADRRVRLLVLTDAGAAAAAAGDRAVRAMEQAWRDRLGAARWDVMRGVLADLAASGAGSEQGGDPSPAGGSGAH
ncbi:MarR family winged helix-turn-helix transcriptional regulator [Nocardioides sp. AX2bis]|uniref:MarR family winged helix-turn-helix transcriptional regulator n=1 Tax=Nocardioides sp. AX2bis TaxID=2653157 RepID=UPI0012EEE241|nr:MarR family transcriptional regulator [Nocardioides sp. AX2bis]VXC08981.1 conserved hypothetical protein [Nocardioides sp. AX2bis]